MWFRRKGELAHSQLGLHQGGAAKGKLYYKGEQDKMLSSITYVMRKEREEAEGSEDRCRRRDEWKS